jgi:hypothetical protein
LDRQNPNEIHDAKCALVKVMKHSHNHGYEHEGEKLTIRDKTIKKMKVGIIPPDEGLGKGSMKFKKILN